MSTLTYILAALLVFNYLTETESQSQGASLTQRQLFILFAASLVWPLVALGILYECKAELLSLLKVMLDIQPGDLEVDLFGSTQDYKNGILFSAIQSPPGSLEVDPDTTYNLEVDPDTL